MKSLSNKLRSAKRGQAILIIALAMVGLVAFVGLMVDIGVLFMEQGKLKRGIDSGSIAAVQQFRKNFVVEDLIAAANNFLTLNDNAASNINIYRCKDINPDNDPPAVEDPATVGDGTIHDETLCTDPRRKLVRVEAERWVPFSFLRIVGLQGRMIRASSVSEAASIDIVLAIDTSASMSYETYTGPGATDGLNALVDPDGDGGANPFLVDDENPAVCNYDAALPCQPLAEVKDVALQFVGGDFLFFPYDRVSVVAMTSQTAGGDRLPYTVQELTGIQADVEDAIESLRVFEPVDCDPAPQFGPCINYVDFDLDGNSATPPVNGFAGLECPVFRGYGDPDSAGDPSSCNSSNIGGIVAESNNRFLVSSLRRDEALWIIILLAGGPANATNPDDDGNFPHGYCPPSTWDNSVSPFCRDASAASRHGDGDADYDADDYARDAADNSADPDDGSGITIFTIGLGRLVQNASIGDADAGEQLLSYIATEAGDDPDPTQPQANHGTYSYAPNTAALQTIFEAIAENIFTRITQ